MRLQIIAIIFFALLTGACTYTTHVPSSAVSVSEIKAQPGGDVLVRYFDASKTNIRRGAIMVAQFVGRLPHTSREASIQARRTVDPSGAVEYTVLHRAGDNGVQKDVIARFMNAEVEAAAKHAQEIAITPQHYRFKYRGQQSQLGRMAYVFEVQPRASKVGLFKGEIWIDSETGLTLREAGRLVKTPSMFLKRVDFEREYEIQDGTSVPKALRTQVMTRIWGPAELEIRYSDVLLTEPAPTPGDSL